MTEKGKRQLLYRTYAYTKNFSFLIFRILSFKSGKISLRKIFSDNNLSKMSIERRAQRERNAYSKEK